LSSLIRKFSECLLLEGVGDGGDVEERAEAVWFSVRVAVVEENCCTNCGLLINGDNLRDDVGKGIGVEG
jgi:hypothetical protein